MSKLMSIWDFEIQKGKKMSKNSPYVIATLKQMGRKNRFYIEEYEKVFDPAEFLLTLFDVASEYDKKRGNTNASK